MTNGTEHTGQPQLVSPEDIQHQEFAVSRFGGYRMRDVDEFLDQLTASTQALIAENERLRSGAGPILGTPDLDEVNRQADEILVRAREEAARIVADASATTVSATPSAPGDRAAVDAFLTQERDFLQNLATLVQAHAETVKAMAKRARQTPATEAAPPAAAAAAAPEPEAVVDVTDDAAEPTQAEMPAPADEPEPERAPARPVPPAPRTAPARADDGGEGDPSLRALFWGDD
jgi:DivIVA domain-containing protein